MASLDLHGARTRNSLRAAIALAESGLAFRAVPVTCTQATTESRHL